MDNIKEKIDIMKDKISEEKTENQIDKVDLVKEINEIKDTISYILDLIQTRNF
jgi:hypothetical protein